MKGYRRALWLAALLLAVSMAFYTGSTEADPTAIPTMTVPPEPVRLRSVRIRAAGDLMMHKKQLAIAKQKAGISPADDDVDLARFEVVRFTRGGQPRKAL